MVTKAHEKGLPIQSDWSRTHGAAVSAAACLGLITTLNTEGQFARLWRPTAKGLQLLEDNS